MAEGTLQLLSVSEAAARVGLSPYTLRWYEQEGLVAPVGRDSAGHRRYTEADLAWLTLLTRLRRTGMSVREMRRYAELIWAGPQTAGQRRTILEEHRERVLAEIAQLQQDLTTINNKIRGYEEMERNA